MVQELQFAPVPLIVYILPILIFLLAVWGIILAIKSREISAKSLKISIFLPLVVSILGVLWWLGDLVRLLDFDSYILFVIYMIFPLISLISIISSIVFLIKTDKKSTALWSLLYGIVYALVWIYSIVNFRGM